jgi:hypothetical protein
LTKWPLQKIGHKWLVFGGKKRPDLKGSNVDEIAENKGFCVGWLAD